MVGPAKKRQKREVKEDGSMPQKKYYRQRAHANPFSDHDLTYPENPDAMNWSEYYPAYATPPDSNNEDSTSMTQDQNGAQHQRIPKEVTVADIGCGYGGLLFALSPKLPLTLILGMEIRISVTEFVQEKIESLRHRAQKEDSNSVRPSAGACQNIACVRANTMKFLPNFFRKGQLEAIFLCFPDPHFKARKHKQRIVSSSLASEYAYVMKPGGKIYTITDVEDLHIWMVEHLQDHPSFERVGDDEVEADELVDVMRKDTEEGKKVERNGGTKHVAVFRRLEDEPWL